MDKKVIFAVAGSGKTTHIINTLSLNKRSLVVTYTTGNYCNLCRKISEKFNGEWPQNIVVMSFFEFLYKFCYKPYLADTIKAKGLYFKANENKYVSQEDLAYYITDTNYIYYNRLSLLIEKYILEEVKQRLVKYFDELIIDEVQDIAGRDFSFLEKLMSTNISMLFVGDFFQHTYDTSLDGNTNKKLFDNFSSYEQRFIKRGFISDRTTLVKSWRCSPSICEFITKNLGIEIYSNKSIAKSASTDITFLSDRIQIDEILKKTDIVKLHYKNSSKYGVNHKNWGDTKGEDHYQDICVMLNKTTAQKYASGTLRKLAAQTRNRLYVAISRAHGKVFLVNE